MYNCGSYDNGVDIAKIVRAKRIAQTLKLQVKSTLIILKLS
jgi:hypothetical protein